MTKNYLKFLVEEIVVTDLEMRDVGLGVEYGGGLFGPLRLAWLMLSSADESVAPVCIAPWHSIKRVSVCVENRHFQE